MSIRSAVQIAAVTIAAVSAAHVHAGLEQDHCGPQINLEVSAAPVIRTTTSSSAAGSSFQLTGTSIITPSSRRFSTAPRRRRACSFCRR
jgi:hypothetical protein